MGAARKGFPVRKVLGRAPTVPATIVAIGILAITVTWARRSTVEVVNPGADAEAAYQAIVAQIDGQDGSGGNGVRERGGGDIPREGRLMRDLFRPGSAPVVKAVKSKVKQTAPVRRKPPDITGVFISGGYKQATIGGKVVSPGDEVGGYRVIDITPDGATVERDGSTYTLALGGSP